MHIVDFEPGNRFYQRKFIQLPFEIYKNDPNWVPPLLMDLRQIFNARKHGFYQHGEAQFLLAMEGNRPVGRLVMLHNHGNTTEKTANIANFFLFETEEDPKIAKKLFERAFAWAHDRHLTTVLGPKGMTPLDGLGLLVHGFNTRPAFGMPYNPPYYVNYLLENGFQQASSMESGIIQAKNFQLPEKIFRAAALVQERKLFNVLKLKSVRDLKMAVSLLGEMYNQAITGTEGNRPLTDQDLKTLSQGLIWLARPELIKLIIKDKDPVGFMLAYPDISSALQATGGRLFPFGWIRLLWEKYHTDMININGIGIVDEYRGMAATALLFTELFNTVTASGRYKKAEVVQIGIENERMRQELSGIGIDFYKTHALFTQNI